MQVVATCHGAEFTGEVGEGAVTRNWREDGDPSLYCFLLHHSGNILKDSRQEEGKAKQKANRQNQHVVENMERCPCCEDGLPQEYSIARRQTVLRPHGPTMTMTRLTVASGSHYRYDAKRGKPRHVFTSERFCHPGYRTGYGKKKYRIESECKIQPRTSDVPIYHDPSVKSRGCLNPVLE